LVVGLALARAITRVTVARVRAAGFEMLWRDEQRVVRVARGQGVTLKAEIRNRDSLAARYVQLRAVASPDLRVSIEPQSGEVPAAGRLAVEVRVETPRVGRHGIHGLSLEVQGSPGLFEVPLTFANPYGIEVLPRAYGTHMRTARGGRTRAGADAGRPGRYAGEGSELRELRDHQPGDPLRRIAWRASARRGKLLVREHERENRDVVWLLMDASVELWAGSPGLAPLDAVIDEVSTVAQRHLARGDRVGLGIMASRELCWLPPSLGPKHAMDLMNALALNTGCLDADRSDLDASDVAERVVEHMRPLDPAAASRLKASDAERLIRRIERVKGRAPFPGMRLFAQSTVEARLRSYLAEFGIHSPPRLEPERTRTDETLTRSLQRLLYEKPRASIVYVWSPAPSAERLPRLEVALAKLPLRRLDVRWVATEQAAGLASEGSAMAAPVAEAIGIRTRVARERGEMALRRWGLRVHRVRKRSEVRPPT
jgi:uncharacterized protein (DUF58 family)